MPKIDLLLEILKADGRVGSKDVQVELARAVLELLSRVERLEGSVIEDRDEIEVGGTD